MALRVAIDVGYDDIMTEGERKSLATQCGLCHGITSQAEHRPHVSRDRISKPYTPCRRANLSATSTP